MKDAIPRMLALKDRAATGKGESNGGKCAPEHVAGTLIPRESYLSVLRLIAQ